MVRRMGGFPKRSQDKYRKRACQCRVTKVSKGLPGRARENSDDFSNTGCGTKSSVLRRHRVLVGICPDVLAAETSAPRPRSETGWHFAHRNVPARRGLLLRVVPSAAAQTVLVCHVRVANGGMGIGGSDGGHRRRFDV